MTKGARDMLIKIVKRMTYVLSLLLSLHLHADDELKENCLKAWNDSTVIRINRADYQQFGEKYCDCAAFAPFNSREELAEVAQTCMSNTLLHVMLDMIRQQDDSEKLTETLVNSYCQNTLKIIYPQSNKNQTLVIANYCQCVVPELIKSNEETLDDKHIKAMTKRCAALVTKL